MTTKEPSEPLLERWSRLKQETKDQPPREATEKGPDQAVDAKAPPPELPPVDKLTIDSDYRGFFHPKVDEDMRRAALKKLFSDPHFNVMDGLDVYIDDYSKSEPIPPAMLAGLRQAQNILKWAKEDEDKRRDAADQLTAKQQPAALQEQASPTIPADPPREPLADAKAPPDAPQQRGPTG